MITVLIADDQAMVRAGFAALLNAYDDITVVGQAADGAAAVALTRELRPDVVLMDVRMPGTDGIAATRTLNTDADPPKVVMLTTFDIDEYVYEALRAGASGFLLKDALPDELAAAVRVVSTGDALLAPSVTRRLIELYATGPGPQPANRAILEELTAREREILTLIARGLSNAEIAASLFIAEQTVKTHVSRVLQKLGLRDRAQAVMVAYESRLVVPS